MLYNMKWTAVYVRICVSSQPQAFLNIYTCIYLGYLVVGSRIIVEVSAEYGTA